MAIGTHIEPLKCEEISPASWLLSGRYTLTSSRLLETANGNRNDLLELIDSRLREELSADHLDIRTRSIVTERVLIEIIVFKIKSYLSTKSLVGTRTNPVFTDIFHTYDAITNRLTQHILLENTAGFSKLWMRLTDSNPESSDDAFGYFLNVKSEIESQNAISLYRGEGNTEPIHFDCIPRVSDLAAIDLFHGIIVSIPTKEGKKSFLARVMSPDDHTTRETVAMARELGYSRFGASKKKAGKLDYGSVEAHTIIIIEEMTDTDSLSIFGSLELMHNPHLGTEGERLLSTQPYGYGTVNLLAERLRINAESSDEYIQLLDSSGLDLEKFVCNRVEASYTNGEIGTFAFLNVHNGQIKISLPKSFGDKLLYIMVCITAEVCFRRGITTLTAVFQDYLREVFKTAGAEMFEVPGRRIDLLGINSLNKKNNGTSSNLEYFINHPNYFLSNSRLLIPKKVTIGLPNGTLLEIEAGSFLVVGDGPMMRVEIENSSGEKVWIPEDDDMFTNIGLSVAKQILSDRNMQDLLIRYRTVLLGNKPGKRVPIDGRWVNSYLSGPKMYRHGDITRLLDIFYSNITSKEP